MTGEEDDPGHTSAERTKAAEERIRASEERTRAAEERTEAAERRTHLAEDRTIQATERTFAGWIRTSFAAIGVGIGFHALFGELKPAGLPKVIATLFILMAAIMAYSAGKRASATFDRLEAHESQPPARPNMLWVSWSVIASAVILVAALWLMNGSGS